MDAAKPFLDPALQYGAAGVLVLLLIAAAWFFGRGFIQCLTASAERTGSLATVIENAKARDEKVLSALQEVARRLEALERKP